MFVCLLACFSRQSTQLASASSSDPSADCGPQDNLVFLAFLYYVSYSVNIESRGQSGI
jgi:hypothetical protein